MAEIGGGNIGGVKELEERSLRIVGAPEGVEALRLDEYPRDLGMRRLDPSLNPRDRALNLSGGNRVIELDRGTLVRDQARGVYGVGS